MSIPISGQIIVTTAGSAVPFTTRTDMVGTFLISPLSANTGSYCYVGNDGAGDVTSQNGAVLKKDTHTIVITLSDLQELYADSDTTDDGLWYMRVMGQTNQIAPPAG